MIKQENNKINEIKPQKSSMMSSYISMTANNESTLNNGDAVSFDTIDQITSDITYQKDADTITFSESGIYIISWWVNIFKDVNFSFIAITTENQQGTNIASAGLNLDSSQSGRFTLSTSELVGITAGDKIRLVNRSAGAVRLASEQNVSAQLAIVRLSLGDMCNRCMNDYNTFISVNNNLNVDGIMQGQTLEFTDMTLQSNIGFDSNIFTIMSSGLYLVSFRANVFLESSLGMNDFVGLSISLVRDGIIILSSGNSLNDITDVGNTTQTAIVALNKGDKLKFISSTQIISGLVNAGGTSLVASITRIA
ncbi:hypothetical protein PV797_08725 [Clostridiaceae bacterium M8S5]|nr:hypothetical protein PV797_08725 [Clostridiaceae bacterium M8S5]